MSLRVKNRFAVPWLARQLYAQERTRRR